MRKSCISFLIGSSWFVCIILFRVPRGHAQKEDTIFWEFLFFVVVAYETHMGTFPEGLYSSDRILIFIDL